MPLIRGHHTLDGQFTQIRNSWVRDPRLSLGAIGLLTQLLSHEPGWTVTQETLARANRVGRDAIRTLINELVSAGYLDRSESRQRNSAGQLSGYVYTTKDPNPMLDEPMLVQPTQVQPTQVNPLLKKNITKKTIDKNTIDKNRATRLPEEWSPNSDLLEMFKTKWPELDADQNYHIENFKLYWLASGKPMKSWDLTFQKWMNTEQNRQSKLPKKSQDLDSWAREQDEREGNL